MKAAQAAPAARLHVKHPYMVLMGLHMGGFTGMYSETALNSALPDLSKAFGVATSLTPSGSSSVTCSSLALFCRSRAL